MTIRSALRFATKRLVGVSDSPALDAEVLLVHALRQPKEFLFMNPERPLDAPCAMEFQKLVERRRRGTPVAYLTREVWFYDRRFFVDERVFIPRPLTEDLVERALAVIRASRRRPCAFVDIGTGSGCVAISILAELRDHSPLTLDGLTVYATDISEDALEVAGLNAGRHDVADRITFLPGDLLEPLAGKHLDLIVANLPYLPSKEARRLPDPIVALDGGEDGEGPVRNLLEQISSQFSRKPKVLLEKKNGY